MPVPSQGDLGPTADPYASEQIANVIAAVRELKHPTQIGPYHILQLIGEGGMGTVYRAEQRAPIQRVVALKIIKLGMDTRDVIARFESERQALALMDHPNVARVLDAGATESGRPYFVMEFVAGEPITTFADRHKLTVQQRLELFMQACDAVQHAHQKAIIHRDLKPSNILVTQVDDKPVVKVIDFGVAKAISQRLTEKTLFTESGQLVGTPEYMAPEQAAGTAQLDVDTRTDVYSLGVVLYELLTGALPFDGKSLRSAGYNEIQRIIREVDPPRPSTRLSRLGGPSAQEIAQRRQTQLDSLEKQLKNELEWIPLKAMRKDRVQRYATATELSQDIRNYLDHRPLRAGPESLRYRARKFLRRNKRGMAALAVMALLLLSGVTATAYQAIRATRAENRIRGEQARTLAEKQEAERQRSAAEDARAATEQVNQFLVDMFQAVDPAQAQGKPVLVKDVLDQAAGDVSKKLAGRPRVEAAVRGALARTYHALGLYSQAEPQAQRSFELYRQLGGDDSTDTLDAAEVIGLIKHRLGELKGALAIYQDVLARRRRVLGENNKDTIGATANVAVMLQLLGQQKEALALYREVRDRYRALLGPDDPESLRSTGHLGQLLTDMGQYAEAEALLREAYEGRRRVLGDDHPQTVDNETDLAFCMRFRGAYADAEKLMRDGYERSRKIYGDDHSHTIWAEEGLAIILADQGKYDAAIPLYRDSMQRSAKFLGQDNPSTLTIMKSFATALSSAGRYAEAEALERQSLEGLTKRLGPDHPQVVSNVWNLAMTLEKQQKWTEALPLTKDVFDRVRSPGRVQLEPVRRAKYQAGYGICLASLKRFDEAIGPLTEAHDAMLAAGDKTSDVMRNTLTSMVRCAEVLNRPDDAARWRAELSAAQAATQATTAPATQSSSPSTQPG